MSKKVFISRNFHFEAAHYLPNYKGKCANLHGHRFEGRVIVSGEVNSATGFLIDYNDLKKIIEKEIIEPYDHRNLNDYWENPTAENIVVDLFNYVSARLTQYDFSEVKLERLELKETENSNAWVQAE